MKSRPIGTLLLFLGIGITLSAQNKGDKLFDNSILHTIRITSDTDFDNLFTFYETATIEIDGENVGEVGIRKKGNTSILADIFPIKVDINRYDEYLEYDGLKKFNLQNNYDDGSLQRDILVYAVDRRAGLAAPRAAYAQLFYNDMFISVYTLVEQVDKTFLSENFASKNGDLYKGVIQDVNVNGLDVKEGTVANYDNFIANVNSNNLGEYVNLRNYLKYNAKQMLTSDWDSYSYGAHNWYMYYEPKSGLINFIPWDHNYSLGEELPALKLYPLWNPTLIQGNAQTKTLYQQTMCELLDYVLDETFYTDFINHNLGIISSNSGGFTVNQNSVNELIDYISDAKETFATLLSDEGVTCQQFNLPIQPGDLVINEFVASSDSIGGVQEPDGGTPDWLELYNNTNSDITLNERFYLSDDKDFLKKWHFPQPVVIPANDYIIVWADKDVHQEGIHSNFKLSKKQGQLFLTFEDLTIIDQVSYEEQTLNQGYARVPNGTGAFVIQSHTFNANNDDGTSSTSTLDNEEIIQVYPNPTTKSIQVVTSSSIDNLQLFASNGQKMMEQKGNNSFVDLANIPSGVYFLHVQTDSQKKVVKLVKK